MARKLDPEIATKVMLAAGISPLVPYVNSRTNWKSRCLGCRKMISPRLSDVVQGSRCGYCAGVIPDLKKILLNMAKEDLRPLEPYRTALTKWKSECLTCGQIVYPKYNWIQRGQGGCRPCGVKKGGLKNRLTHSQATERLKGAKLHLIGKYENYNIDELKVKCLICKQINTTTLDNISKKYRKPGCQRCSRGTTRVPQEEAIKFFISHGLNPLSPYKSNKKKLKCECLICGEIRFVVRNSLVVRKTKLGLGCNKCAGGRIIDLKVVKVVMKRAKLQPLEPYKNSDIKWKCKCLKCGETVYPVYGSVQQGQGGCVYCASGKINPKQPAFVYLLTHEFLDCVKVGIGSSDSRIAIHRRKGWKLVKRWDFKKGEKAIQIESEVLGHIRKQLGLKHFLSKEEMSQGGHTETFSLDDISIPYLKKFIDSIIS